MVDSRAREVIDKAELFADDLISPSVLDRARELAYAAAVEAARDVVDLSSNGDELIDTEESFWASWANYDLSWAFQAAACSGARDRKSLERTSWLARNACSARAAQQAKDPNSSRSDSWNTMSTTQCALIREIFPNPFRPVPLPRFWLTSTVRRVARRIDQTCRFHEMPILADALEEAGCTHLDVLDHCRLRPSAQQNHVRGCWVLDLILQEE